MAATLITRSLLGLAFLAATGSAGAQTTVGTAFNFQGELRDAGAPAQGSYDFRARLYTEVGNLLLVDSILDDVAVVDGRFTLPLDFTDYVFREFGDQLALEIATRAGSSTGDFTVLGPRVRLESAPYALVSKTVVPNSIGIEEIDPQQVQARVTGTCPPDAAISTIAADGSVTCDVDNVGMTITPGFGIVGGGAVGDVTLAIDPVEIQRRVTGSCPAGSSIRTINQDGTVQCEVDDGAGAIATIVDDNTFPGFDHSTSYSTAIMVCPSGTRALGGGFWTNCPGVLVFHNGPSQAGTVWSVEVVKPSGTRCHNNSGQLTGYALCAPL
jgi:hypothetical protein